MHSCELQLLTDDFAKALNNKLQVNVSILFDKVPHKRLLAKIEFYGIRGKVLKWLEFFVNNHSQQVVVNGSFSSPCQVVSGFSFGTYLLFIVH